jgi:nitroreductase
MTLGSANAPDRSVVEAVTGRRSVRRFLPTPVEEVVVRAI